MEDSTSRGTTTMTIINNLANKLISSSTKAEVDNNSSSSSEIDLIPILEGLKVFSREWEINSNRHSDLEALVVWEVATNTLKINTISLAITNNLATRECSNIISIIKETNKGNNTRD